MRKIEGVEFPAILIKKIEERDKMYNNFFIDEVNSDFVSNYKEKRDCFCDLYNYLIKKEPNNKICALYGLRRTGKTVLMQQAAKELYDKENIKSLFITCAKHSDLFYLFKILDEKIKEGYRYFFIDEITHSDNFQELGDILSNRYVNLKGVKIVVTGTDSLGLILPTKGLQLDRINLIHTTHISFAEYSRIMNCTSLDNYILEGGLLSPECYSSYYKVHEYISSSIVDNFIDSLEKSEGIYKYKKVLTEIYENEELKNAIERIVNKYSQELTAKAINKEFKSSIIETSISDFIRRNENPENYKILLNSENLNLNISKSLGILKNEEMLIRITEEHKNEIYNLLKDMDVFISIPFLKLEDKLYKNSLNSNKMDLMIHPGMYYSNVIYSLEELYNNDNWLVNASKEQRKKLIEGSLEVALGNIMENIIISDTFFILNSSSNLLNVNLECKAEWYVSKVVYKEYEADMIIKNFNTNEIYLFEIKHSDKIVANQEKNLINTNFLNKIEEFGDIKYKAVLYNGDTDFSNFIPRISAQEFLLEMYEDIKGNNLKNAERYNLDSTLERIEENWKNKSILFDLD